MIFSWRQVFRSIIIVVLALSVIILFTPFLLPLTLGGILSVVIFPLYKKLLAHRWNPTAAALSTLLVFSLVFVVPTTLVVIKGARVTSEYVRQTLEAKKPADVLDTEEKKSMKNICWFFSLSSL